MNSQLEQIKMMSGSDENQKLSPLERLPAEIRNRIFTLAVRKDAYVELRLATRQIPLAATNKKLREQVLPIFYGINTFVLNTTDRKYGLVSNARLKPLVGCWGKYLKFMKHIGAYSPDSLYCLKAGPQLVPSSREATLGWSSRAPQQHHVDREGNSVSLPGSCDLTRLHISIKDDATVQVDFGSLGGVFVPPCVCSIMNAIAKDNGSAMSGLLIGRLMLAAVDDLATATRQTEDDIDDDDLRDAVLDEIYEDGHAMEAHDRAWATAGCNDCKEFRNRGRTMDKTDSYARR